MLLVESLTASGDRAGVSLTSRLIIDFLLAESTNCLDIGPLVYWRHDCHRRYRRGRGDWLIRSTGYLISGSWVELEIYLIQRLQIALILLWYPSVRQRRARMNALDKSSRSSVVAIVIKRPKLALEGPPIVVQKLLINAILIRITRVVLDFMNLTFILTKMYDLRSRNGL